MMGDKLEARKIARAAGVPLVPGSDQAQQSARSCATRRNRSAIPLLLKASAGGGGRGIKLVSNPSEIEDTFRTAAAEARAAFGNDTLYMERYVGNARHIEVQILGDQHGNVIHLGERDCSLQRRHQKIVEEAPAYAVPRTSAPRFAPRRRPWRATSATAAPAPSSSSTTTTRQIFIFSR